MTQPSLLRSDAAELSTDQKTAALIEALPYICEYVGKTIVVKVGGSVGEEGTVLDDVVWLKRLGINPVLVHGGGPQISDRLSQLGVETRFVEGRRFTDEQTLEVVHEVLMRINGAFVSYLNAHRIPAWGCNGLDGEMLQARLRDERLGLVGEVAAVNLRPIKSLVEQGYVVVIAPLAAGPDSQPLNVNADTVAGEVARASARARFSCRSGSRPTERSRTAANSVQSRLATGSEDGSGKRSKLRNWPRRSMRKSRCGPVARPVMPTRPMR